jgi:hypothetical protein
MHNLQPLLHYQRGLAHPYLPACTNLYARLFVPHSNPSRPATPPLLDTQHAPPLIPPGSAPAPAPAPPSTPAPTPPAHHLLRAHSAIATHRAVPSARLSRLLLQRVITHRGGMCHAVHSPPLAEQPPEGLWRVGQRLHHHRRSWQSCPQSLKCLLKLLKQQLWVGDVVGHQGEGLPPFRLPQPAAHEGRHQRDVLQLQGCQGRRHGQKCGVLRRAARRR